MSKTIIATDLDRTLLNKESQITEYTKEIINKAIKQDILIVPCTARSYKSLPTSLLESDIRYYICSNGAIVYDKKEDQVILSYLLETSCALEVIDLVKDYKVVSSVIKDGVVYSEKAIREVLKPLFSKEEIDRWLSTRVLVDDVKALLKQHKAIEKLHFNFFDTQEKLESRQIIDQFLGYPCTSSGVENLEVTHALVNKGHTLLKLCSLLTIDYKRILAFGDNLNDLTLFDVADECYAVSNAHASLKENADYVLSFSNDENAVAKEIEKIISNSN